MVSYIVHDVVASGWLSYMCPDYYIGQICSVIVNLFCSLYRYGTVTFVIQCRFICSTKTSGDRFSKLLFHAWKRLDWNWISKIIRPIELDSLLFRQPFLTLLIWHHGWTTKITPFVIGNLRRACLWHVTKILSQHFFRVSEDLRPVKLERHVLGYPYYNSTPFRFDMSLTYKLPQIIEKYSNNKPALVKLSISTLPLPLIGKFEDFLFSNRSSAIHDEVLKWVQPQSSTKYDWICPTSSGKESSHWPVKLKSQMRNKINKHK